MGIPKGGEPPPPPPKISLTKYSPHKISPPSPVVMTHHQGCKAARKFFFQKISPMIHTSK